MLQPLALVALAALAATPIVRARRRAAALERRLDDLSRDTQRAIAARRQLLSALNHDLRSPISAILGYQELIEDGVYGAIDERARDALERIGRATRELVFLLDAVVDVARLEAGDDAPRPRRTRVDELIDGALAQMIERGDDRAHVQRHDDSGSLSLHVDTDRARLLLDLATAVALHAAPDHSIAMHVFRDGPWAHIDLAATRRPAAGPTATDAPAAGTLATAPPGHHDRTFARSLRLDLAIRLAPLLGATLDHDPAPDGARLRLTFSTADPAH